MATHRKAEVEWIGGLIDGEGKIISTTSGLIPELDVTWDARNDETEEKTESEGEGGQTGDEAETEGAEA